MSRFSGGGGGGRRPPAPSYQTTSSSSRNYSSSAGADRELSRSYSSANGGNSANYYSSSRKPEAPSAGYSYLEPNWIEKTRSTLPVDPYASHSASGYLDRAPIPAPYASSRDYPAPAAPTVYPSSAAAALSVGGGAYGASSTMPKAYARTEEYFRTPPSLTGHGNGYGYGSGGGNAYEQSTMAAQAAALYELQHAKQREEWAAPPSMAVAGHHGGAMDYGRRTGDRRSDERRRDEGRKDERRGGDDRRAEAWRGSDPSRDRRPPVPSRERDRDLRAPVAAPPSSRRVDHSTHGRDVRRETAAAGGGTVRATRDTARDRDLRASRDISSRRAEERKAVDTRLDRESRELERQLAKVQRELKQLESGGGGARGKEREIDRSRKPPPRRPSPPRRRVAPALPRRSAILPPRSLATRTFPARMPAVRPTRPIGGRSARQSALLPSLLDGIVSCPAPGRRGAPPPRVSRVSTWEAPMRRGVAPRSLASSRGAVNGGGVAAGGRATTRRVVGRRGETLSSKEKVRRAKEKLRKDEESKRKTIDRRREERDKEKRMEEDFAWLETIISEDEEVDEEAIRKLLLAPRQLRVLAIVDSEAVHPHTLQQLQDKVEADAVSEPMLWSAEETDEIELLPIIDSEVSSLAAEVAAAYMEAHPEEEKEEGEEKKEIEVKGEEPKPDSNGNEKMEE